MWQSVVRGVVRGGLVGVVECGEGCSEGVG